MDKADRERAEAERIAAEKEFQEQFLRQRRLSTGRSTMFSPGSVGGDGSLQQSGVSSVPESESELDGNNAVTKRPRDKEGSTEKRKRKKKKKVGDGIESEEDEEDEEEDPLVSLGNVLQRLREWVVQPSHATKISKPQTEKYRRYLARFEEDLISAREERARLETKVEERTAMASIVRITVREEIEKAKDTVVVQPATSFADVVRIENKKIPPVTGVSGPVKPAPKRVVVRHDEKESEEVEATLKRLVQPSKIGLKVRKLIKIRRGVIVEAEDETGADNLAKQDVLKQAGLKVERPEKKKPRIIVYDVRKDLTDEEISEEVFSKNMRGHMTKEEFNEEFQVKHKYKDARSEGRLNNLVVECSVRVRNMLRDKERIFIEWQSCRVKDYIDVPRCFKCQKHGHVAKYCTSAKVSCSYCAGEHDHKECQDKNRKDKVCCANCQRDGRPDTKHDAGWKKCPAFQIAAKRYNDKIDYGIEN